jgi:glycosyltransferase involved in cell wall biosynthesis
MRGWRELLRKTPVEALATRRRQARIRALLAASPLFDADWYGRTHTDLGGLSPVDHYVLRGATEGRRPSPWFDAAWYVRSHADVADTGQNPLAHYIQFGAAEDRDPNPFFATRWYRTNNPDARAWPTPLDHYAAVGRAVMRDPSPGFDARWYAECNPEAGDDPLGHFLLVGRAAGRAPSPYVAAPQGEPVGAARIEAFKAMKPVAGETVALFAAYAPDGKLKPNVLPYVSALADRGLKVVLVAATDAPLAVEPELTAKLAGGFVRDNAGYDFAAWAHVMRAEPGLFAAETLLLVNDSLIGPGDPAALAALLARIAASPADVVGATDSREHAWHLQSFFLAFKRKALASAALQSFFGEVRALDDKDEVIRAYEVPLAERLMAAGLTCEALLPSPDGLNQTVFRWRELLDAGFPFVKTLTLRGEGEAADLAAALQPAGFDMAVVEATLGATPKEPPPPKAWPLLKDAGDRVGAARPWKVAFIGPWNYASGLGEASRGCVSALYRAGVRLNLHPIERPLHFHARVAPTVAVREFEGPADAVIVHLNPDSWGLLSEEQQAVVERARSRAGLWVWEMGHLPDSWRANFGRVEAIWAPSRYCAEVFEREARVPVEVVPHVVPVGAEPDPAERAAVLERCGLAADAKIVLYAFDGSSYLARKNPQALVRAFEQSGLAADGWRLVLKTKRLMEQPAEGRELAAMMERAGGVLIDQGMSRDDMTALFAAADIYASPHRSEGFGLTVAEAMALGKPVVATDYGGVRDFLDASCGYPVKAREVKLDRDFGHYTRGGTWAEVDEAAFAEALRAAASDQGVGALARARIAERLSADAVGQTMRRALDALIVGAVRAA